MKSSLAKEIPFHPNEPDDMHCVHAAFWMIIEYFEPDRKLNMRRMEEIVGFEPGSAAYQSQALLWLIEQGYDVRIISLFDLGEFSKSPQEYLRKVLDHKAFEWSIQYTHDMKREGSLAGRLLKEAESLRRKPSVKDIAALISEGFVPLCLVNGSFLHGNPGYSGHSVLVSSVSDTNLVIHDPGLPPRPSFAVTPQEFEKAWEDAGGMHRDLMAVRKVDTRLN